MRCCSMKDRFLSLNLDLSRVFWVAALFGLAPGALAQSDSGPVSIGIFASDMFASENAAGFFGPGAFIISRSGDTNEAISVGIQYSGTAEAGVDYQPLPGIVFFPAGVRSTELAVQPIDDALSEARETVVASLVPSPDGQYQAGYLRNNTVYIVDDA